MGRHMAGRVPLAPVFLTGARPERHATGRQRAPQRLVVHVADHQHLVRVILLDDRGDQPARVTLEPRSDARVEFVGVVIVDGGLRICHVLHIPVHVPMESCSCMRRIIAVRFRRDS